MEIWHGIGRPHGSQEFCSLSSISIQVGPIDGMRAMQAVAETMMARDGKSPQLRLLVPTPLCGSIIGKGGATIRSFAEDSQAAITVSPQACPPRKKRP